MQATSGNLSLMARRDPLEFYISVSGRDKSVSLPDDFILVNEKGVPVFGLDHHPAAPLSLKPSAEVGVHSALYQKTGASVVLHVHTLYNTLISRNASHPDRLILENYEMIKGLGLWEESNRVTLPIIPNHHDLEKLSKAAGRSADPEVPGILIRGHGLYAWGRSISEVKRNVEAFEFLFQAAFLEMQIARTGGL